MSTKQEILRPTATHATVLQFVPSAWAKLLYLQKCGNTEIAGYCVTGTANPLLVTDFRLVKQECTGASFDLDSEDSAEFLEQMTDDGFMPWQFQRILAHTHPGNSPNPSDTDEKNFEKVFSSPDWAIMLIVADNGAIYCRLKFNVGPGGAQMLKVEVDFSQEFPAADHKAWEEEYKEKVKKLRFRMTGKESTAYRGDDSFLVDDYEDYESNLWATRKRELDRQIEEAGGGIEDIGCELTECHWDNNGDVAVWEDFEGKWYYYDPVEKKWQTEEFGDDDDEIVEIEPSDVPWAAKVVAWAEKHINERESVLAD